MAQYFREFRDLTSDHEIFPHEKLALYMGVAAYCAAMQGSGRERLALAVARWRIANTCNSTTYVPVRIRVRTFTAHGSQRLEDSREHGRVSPAKGVQP